jgi:DNA-binding NtrC family response regulator
MPSERILIVDDERPVAESLQRLLQADGYSVDVATNAADARSLLGRVIYDLAVLDLRMPDVSGIDMLALCREIDPAIATLMLTAYGTVEAAVQSFQLGAKDFLTKPVRHEELLAAVERALALSRMTREARTLRQHFLDSVPFQAILGRTPELQRQLQLAADAAPSDISVVILGETGTGKGMAARAIHGASRRAGQPLVRAGIAGRSPALLDSDLFGHVKGAFTGATCHRRGRFQTAHGGTLFLDEIGELPPESQVLLLETIEERQVRPVGADKEIPIDVRLLSATHHDLARDIQAGRFREDLYYRLGKLFVRLPPLRERRDDIPLLAAHFARKFLGEGRDLPEFEPAALDALWSYHWPGNVRELENVIERAVLLSRGDTIRCGHCLLQAVTPERPDSDPTFAQPLKEAVDQFTAAYLRRLLARHGGDTQKVADHARVHVTSIRRKMRELGIARHDESA